MRLLRIPLRCRVRSGVVRCCARGSECHRDTFMQQHLPFFGLHTLAKLPHCKSSPPHLNWLLAAPACGAIDSNISAADSVTISIRMIWLPSPQCTALSLSSATTLRSPNTAFEFNMHFCEGSLDRASAANFGPPPPPFRSRGDHRQRMAARGRL